MNEFELIKRFFSQSKVTHSVLQGIGDDAAVLALPGLNDDLVVATDTLVENRHFPKDAPAAAIAEKALASNLSDLAAMGAKPKWFLLNLTLPEANTDWLNLFSERLFKVAKRHHIELVGGDTTSGPLTISMQLIGTRPREIGLYRKNAMVGDLIYVSGTLGDAAYALNFLPEPEDYWHKRYYQPTPQIMLGIGLREIANAMIDISDGFCADLQHILDASGVGAIVESALLPLSSELKSATGTKAIDYALNGGDDYELIFTVPNTQQTKLETLSQTHKTSLTQVGHITDSNQLEILDEQGHPLTLKRQGFKHFD